METSVAFSRWFPFLRGEGCVDIGAWTWNLLFGATNLFVIAAFWFRVHFTTPVWLKRIRNCVDT